MEWFSTTTDGYTCFLKPSCFWSCKLPASPSRSVAATRKQLIDEHLRRAGWRIMTFDPARQLSSYGGAAVEEYPTENGPAVLKVTNERTKMMVGREGTACCE